MYRQDAESKTPLNQLFSPSSLQSTSGAAASAAAVSGDGKRISVPTDLAFAALIRKLDAIPKIKEVKGQEDEEEKRFLNAQRESICASYQSHLTAPAPTLADEQCNKKYGRFWQKIIPAEAYTIALEVYGYSVSDAKSQILSIASVHHAERNLLRANVVCPDNPDILYLLGLITENPDSRHEYFELAYKSMQAHPGRTTNHFAIRNAYAFSLIQTAKRSDVGLILIITGKLLMSNIDVCSTAGKSYLAHLDYYAHLRSALEDDSPRITALLLSLLKELTPENVEAIFGYIKAMIGVIDNSSPPREERRTLKLGADILEVLFKLYKTYSLHEGYTLAERSHQDKYLRRIHQLLFRIMKNPFVIEMARLLPTETLYEMAKTFVKIIKSAILIENYQHHFCLGICLELLKREPENPDFHHINGLVTRTIVGGFIFDLEKIGTYHRYVTLCYDRALELNPNHVPTLVGRGEFLYFLENPVEELIYYEKEIKRLGSPGHAELYHCYNQKLKLFKREAEADENYRKVAELPSTDAEFHQACGEAFFRQGQYAQAVLCFERMLALNPSFRGTESYPLALQELSRDADALHVFIQLNNEYSSRTYDFHFQHGLAYLAMGQCEEARAMMAKAKESYSFLDLVDAIRKEVPIRVSDDDPDKTIDDYIDEAKEIVASKTPRFIREFSYIEALYQWKDPRVLPPHKEVFLALNRGLQRAPGNAELHYQQGRTLLATKRHDVYKAALVSLTKAVTLCPERAEYHLERAKAQTALSLHVEAWESLKASLPLVTSSSSLLIKFQPECRTVLFNLIGREEELKSISKSDEASTAELARVTKALTECRAAANTYLYIASPAASTSFATLTRATTSVTRGTAETSAVAGVSSSSPGSGLSSQSMAVVAPEVKG